MYNDLFSVFGLTVHGYGLMIGLGTVFCLLWTERKARARGMDVDFLYTLFMWVLIIGWTGAKLLYIITVLPYFLQDPLSVLGGEGFVVYGGIIAGVLAAVVLCRRRRENILDWMDLLLPGVALAQGFGRIGCFLAGCCYGRPTHSPLGVVFPAGSFAPAGIPLLPTQLFSAAGDFLLCVLLARLDSKPHRSGRTTACYLIFYSIGRFIVEFFRDDYRGAVGFLSTSQFISLFTVILGAALYYVNKKGEPAHD